MKRLFSLSLVLILSFPLFNYSLIAISPKIGEEQTLFKQDNESAVQVSNTSNKAINLSSIDSFLLDYFTKNK